MYLLMRPRIQFLISTPMLNTYIAQTKCISNESNHKRSCGPSGEDVNDQSHSETQQGSEPRPGLPVMYGASSRLALIAHN